MNLPLIRLRCRAAKQKRPEIWIVLSVSQVLRLVDLQPCIESIGMLTSDELRHADKSQRWHRNHSGDERVADAARLSSPIPRKSHLRRAGWDYGGVDGQDRAARRQSGTLLRVTVGVVGQAGLSPDSPSVRGLGFPARHRAATSAPSCRSCPNRALSESCTSPSFARSADHIRSHSCIPPLYKIYISIIAGSRDACFAGTRHCARVASRCATPHRVTHDENPCNHWDLGISSLCAGRAA